MGFLDARGPGPPPLEEEEAAGDSAPLGAGRADDAELTETERADVEFELFGGGDQAPNEAPDEQAAPSDIPEGPHQGTSDAETEPHLEPEALATPEPPANPADVLVDSDSDLSEGLVEERQRRHALAAMSFVARRQEHVVQNGVKHKKSREIQLSKLGHNEQELFIKGSRGSRAKDSWLRYEAVEFLSDEEQRKVPADRIMQMRMVETDKNGANRGAISYD